MDTYQRHVVPAVRWQRTSERERQRYFPDASTAEIIFTKSSNRAKVYTQSVSKTTEVRTGGCDYFLSSRILPLSVPTPVSVASLH